MNGSVTYTEPAGAGGGGGGTVTDVTELSGVKVVTSGTTKELFNRLAYFFVDQYGAVGNGVTDDTAAIQAAFAAAGASGAGNNVVYFPAGIYLISGSIVFPAGKTISVKGGGYNGVNAGGTSGGNSVSVIKTATDAINAFQTDGSNVDIEGLAFACTVSQTSGSAITCSGVGLTIRGCEIIGGFFNGLVCTQNELTVVERCEFFDQVNHSIDFSNSASADNGDALILACALGSSVIPTIVGIYSRGSGGLKVSGCKFVSAANAAVSMQTCIEYEIPDNTFSTSDLLVSNCSIEQFSITGIGINMDNGGGRFANVVLVGNQIGSFQGGNGIDFNGTASDLFNLVITGNVFTSNSDGMKLTNTGSCVVSGNIFYNNSVDVDRIGTTAVLTGFQGDDNAAPPVNPVTPAAWSDVTLYTAAGPVTYKVPLYL
jgi:parallel beta-helix repeat protein